MRPRARVIYLVGISCIPFGSQPLLRRSENDTNHRSENAPHSYPTVTRARTLHRKRKSPAA